MKLKLAVVPPAPKLKMANTGSTTAVEKVNVLTFTLFGPPSNYMTPSASTGALATTVPSAQVPDGAQLLETKAE